MDKTNFINDAILRIISNYTCKKCKKFVVKSCNIKNVSIITSSPIDIICDICQRDDKIENLLK